MTNNVTASNAMCSHARFNRRLAKQYDQWMVAMHYAKTTQILYRRVIRRYSEFLGDKSIASANHFDIRHYIAQTSENGATLNSVYRDLGVLRLFYDFLNLGGLVHYVAPRFVKLRRPWTSNPRPLSEWQVQPLIAATRTLRERALVEFFYATGCRLSEAIGLRIQDLDLDAKSARVRGKLGKVRTVLLTQNAMDAMRQYIAARKDGFVFQEDLPVQKGCLFASEGQWKSKWGEFRGTDRKRIQRHKCLGPIANISYELAKQKHEELIASLELTRPPRKRPLSKVAIQAAIRQIAVRAGIKNVTPHTFRRTFASHLYDHGAGVEVIKALMGHVWIQTTMKYAHIGPDRMAKTFEQCHPRGKLNGQQSD
ncbi:MAG: tyrosine-type recombinase/integrase [Candidatus Acidiferrales bacterium]